MAEQFVLTLTYAEVMSHGQVHKWRRHGEGDNSSGDFCAVPCTAKLIREPNPWRPSVPAASPMLFDSSTTLPHSEPPLDGSSQTDPSR